ncbi:MAG: preprotein translocase subunit SecY [Pseudomonadota bacterium]
MIKNNYSELFQRLRFLLLTLLVYRLGVHIPVPGVNVDSIAALFNSKQSAGFIGLLNVFSGGAAAKFSVMAIGVMPYISASIVMQLASVAFPTLEALKKEGEWGKKRLAFYSRWLTLALAIVQSAGIVITLSNQSNVLYDTSMLFLFSCIISLVAGTFFLVWLGEGITIHGIGNGLSVLIFSGIVSGLPGAVTNFFSLISSGHYGSGIIGILKSLFLIFIILASVVTVVFFEKAFRKVPVLYARKSNDHKQIALERQRPNYLPLKVNVAGAMPPIFASSLIILPATVFQWFSSGATDSTVSMVLRWFTPGQPAYFILYAVAIVFFSFFYVAIQYNPKDTAENIKKSGAVIPGYRPGIQTIAFIESVILRLTFLSAIYMLSVCLLPEFLVLFYNLPFYFGGTSLLIVVLVSFDLISSIQHHIFSSKYDSLVKKVALAK